MPSAQKLDTHHKALTLNLDTSTFGSFAEIGAGQEVARWFLLVGGASGTVAKTISAYDKEVSDDLYGSGSRYVSKQRLEAMLENEWTQLLTQLSETRGPRTRFFCFVDTVSARNFAGTNEAHGWIGLRFQVEPGGPPNDVLLHINMRDPSNVLQQQAVGVLGVNLIYAAFYEAQTKELFLECLAQDISERIEIDYVDLRGKAFENWDSRALLIQLVRSGLAEAVFFPAEGTAVPPTEVLYKKAVALAPGYFDPSAAVHLQVHSRLLVSAIKELEKDLGEKSPTAGFFCLTIAPSTPGEPTPEIPDLLRRIDGLLAAGGDVLLFRNPELFHMTAFVNRYTQAPVRFVAGLSLIIRTFEDAYGNLDGRLLEALARLFAQNVRIFVYPMTVADLQEWLKNASTNGWEWSETNGWVSANQLRHAPPLGHLFAYLLASNFIVPIQFPVESREI